MRPGPQSAPRRQPGDAASGAPPSTLASAPPPSAQAARVHTGAPPVGGQVQVLQRSPAAQRFPAGHVRPSGSGHPGGVVVSTTESSAAASPPDAPEPAEDEHAASAASPTARHVASAPRPLDRSLRMGRVSLPSVVMARARHRSTPTVTSIAHIVRSGQEDRALKSTYKSVSMNSMARPVQREDVADTPDRILDAAEVAFGDAGFEGARLGDIAARAGIRRPSLLYHFATKEALYAAVVERAFADVGREVVGALAEAVTLADRVTLPARRFEAFLQRRAGVGRLLLRELLDGCGPGRELVARHAAPILAEVEAHLRAGACIPAEFPLRSALMQTVANLMLWSIAGPLRAPLWGGGGHHSTVLAEALLGVADTG